VYNVKPAKAVLARYLFSKDNWRAALGNKSVELWPQVPLVVNASIGPGHTEGLAGAASGPDGAVVGPPGETEGV
jgi:hypothetical protein